MSVFCKCLTCPCSAVPSVDRCGSDLRAVCRVEHWRFQDRAGGRLGDANSRPEGTATAPAEPAQLIRFTGRGDITPDPSTWGI